MRSWLLLITLFVSSGVSAQVKQPYSLFDEKGKSISYEKLLKACLKSDVVFFGELHNNTLNHWLELQILKDLHKEKGNIAMGMEMFEADDQLVLDEYLSKLIEEKQFLAEAKFWDNYKSDYRPLIEYAKSNNIAVIATNVPRRYANVVYKKGLKTLDTLSQETKALIVPLPLTVDYTLSNYKAMLDGMAQHGGGSAENLVASQALKDATMAHNIAKNLKVGQIFYHVNGAYHSQDNQGILTYLREGKPKAKVLTIHVVEQDNIDTLEQANAGKADFTFCIAKDMIKSY